MGDERQRRTSEAVADLDRLGERRECRGDAVRVLGEHRRDRLPREHFVPRLHSDHESDGGIDHVVHRGPAAAEIDHRPADESWAHPGDDARPRRREDLDRLGLRQDGGIFHDLGIPALRLDHLFELLRRESRAEGVLEALAGLGAGLLHAGGQQHLDAERVSHVHQVGRAFPAQRQDRFFGFERVAAGPAEGSIHRRQQRDGGTAAIFAEGDHRPGQLETELGIRQERALAVLHVEHQGVESLGELLRHDAGGDQGDRLDGPGDVPQGVEFLVRRRDLRRLPDQHAPQRHQLGLRLGQRDLGAESRNRFELVERAAGVPEAAPRHHRDGDAAGGDERRQDQGHLVADAAGRVFVDARRGPAVEVEALSGGEHGVGEGGELVPLETAQEHRHEERGHLVVGDAPGGVGGDQRRPLLGAQRPAVALALDHRHDEHYRPLPVGNPRCVSRCHSP